MSLCGAGGAVVRLRPCYFRAGRAVDRPWASIYGIGMNITVKCFASLSRFSPPNAEAYPVTPGDTAQSVVERLGIPLDDLKLVFVNGTHAPLTTILAEGDRLGLFPAVGGG